MQTCPLCHSSATEPYPFKAYVVCTECRHAYQLISPPKTWANPSPGVTLNGYEGAVMGEQEKSVNKRIADWVCDVYKPKTSLDIGSGYPWLAYCFQQRGVVASALEGREVSNDLAVNLIRGDWESIEGLGTYDVITLIHVLEHFYDPVAALKKVTEHLTPDGVAYLRLPNASVSGIERDHTENHALIHPNIFSTESFMYAARKAGLHVMWFEHMNGWGQTSWVLRKRPATISLCMIVKNEEHNIAECLNSVRSFCNEMIVVDTGSTDKTIELASAAGAKVYKSRFFHKDTPVAEFNFAQARNEALSYGTGDWLFWMDADDRFRNPDRLVLSPDKDAYEIFLEFGSTKFTHARFFRNNFGVRFEGAIHEFPIIHTLRIGRIESCTVHHLIQDKPRGERNIAILEREHKRDPNNKRTLFYYANALRERGKLAEAITIYNRYINLGGNFHDELLLAHYYIGLCHYDLGKFEEATRTGLRALGIDDRWAEIYCLIGQSYYRRADYKRAVSYFHMAACTPYPPTKMFVNRAMYNAIPFSWLSLCYEKLGNLDLARDYAEGDPKRLEALKNRKHTIEVNRPGAYGDVLMTTPVVHELRKAYPGSHIRFVTKCREVLENNPDIDEITTEGKAADIKINFSYPMHLGYPDTPLSKHLVHFFADDAKVTLPPDWKLVLDISNEPVPNWPVGKAWPVAKPVITFSTKTGWSKYKEWPLERWNALINALHDDYHFVQIGAKDDPPVSAISYNMCGALSIRATCAFMKRFASLHIGQDSLFTHVAAALNIPAVVLYGSTSPTGSGYDKNLNIYAGLGCQPCYRETNSMAAHKKSPCPYDHKCMVEYITVDRVIDAVRTKLHGIVNVGAQR